VTVRFLVLALLFSVVTAPAIAQAAEGILITQRVTSGGTPLTIQVQIEASRMRTEMALPTGAVNTMIFDGGKQVVYIVDPARKTYMEITKADVERLSAQLQGAMAQMQAQLAKLPPAQRAQMEALMKGGGVQLARTGSDKVGRWTCDNHDLMLNGQKIGEMCSVNPATLGFTAKDFEVTRQMGAFYASMAPQIASQLPGVSGLDPRGSSDFPVRTVMLGMGQTVTTEVVEAARQTFPDSLFAVPAGFAKQDLPPMLGGVPPAR
jgi:hypothetical protein